jgi:hypothetical protein
MAGTPIERMENPFRGVSAPGAVPNPSARSTKVELRGMTGFEEEVAERRRNDANTAALCNEIVARCMTSPGEDFRAAMQQVRSMLIARRDEALITIRRLSLGDVVSTIVICPHCKKQNDVEFPLSSLPVEIAEPPDRVDVKLDDGTHVSMRLPTAGDQEELLNEKLESESERRTWLLARVILSFGDEGGPFEMDFARSLPIGARRKLEAALEKVVPDLDLTMAINCAECGQPFKSAFDVAAFFLPK